MKSSIFTNAIKMRKKVKFLYGFNEITLEPYYIATNSRGKKIVFGRINGSNIIRMFEYEKITNIKILDYSRFSAILPLGYATN